MCVRVLANWLKRGVAMGVAYCKKEQNFQIDAQTCTRFRGKGDDVPKDS